MESQKDTTMRGPSDAFVALASELGSENGWADVTVQSVAQRMQAAAAEAFDLSPLQRAILPGLAERVANFPDAEFLANELTSTLGVGILAVCEAVRRGLSEVARAVEPEVYFNGSMSLRADVASGQYENEFRDLVAGLTGEEPRAASQAGNEGGAA